MFLKSFRYGWVISVQSEFGIGYLMPFIITQQQYQNDEGHEGGLL